MMKLGGEGKDILRRIPRKRLEPLLGRGLAEELESVPCPRSSDKEQGVIVG